MGPQYDDGEPMGRGCNTPVMPAVLHPLDNPVWDALTTVQSGVAVGSGRARRYRSDISVFCGMPDSSDEAWSDLAAVGDRDGLVVLFRPGRIDEPEGWERLYSGSGIQMVLEGEPRSVPALPGVDTETGSKVTLRSLGDADVDQMIALVARTEPGPFLPRTIDLGGYVGIFHGPDLVAMAGQRMRPTGHCEISAVCTDDTARRRGYASIVTATVAEGIRRRGEVPFLNVRTDNVAAIPVYERLGFVERSITNFAVLRRPTD